MNRRDFNFLPLSVLFGSAAVSNANAAETVAVQYRKPAAYLSLEKLIAPDADEFPIERDAMAIERRLQSGLTAKTLPLPADWFDSLGKVTNARFYALAASRVRFEIASTDPAGLLAWRTGEWEVTWSGERLQTLRSIREDRVTAREPLFRDITGPSLGQLPAFRDQLAKGIPYWRARLDPACGIDVYGTNGIAVADIDNDGVDEIYVCQPGGLPNRLLKRGPNGAFIDLTDPTTTGILDHTSSALFADFRNVGLQDLVVLTSTGPIYFVNQGGGKFREKSDVFRFARPASGAFTGMAAADFDRDGKLDLYLCTYIYFQNEDQYRYPVPYHDAQHGPPNHLFRNRLTETGEIVFEDVTVESGIDHNNNRYSFAAAWCDYDEDGWPELYVANDFGHNNLYKYDGKQFRDVAADKGVEDIGPGMSASWFDYDSDGRDDLYVANMWSPAGQRISSQPDFAPVRAGAPKEAYRRHSKGNSLYRNQGSGPFQETGASEGAEMGRWAWCADGFDFDNDGSPEIYVAAGMITNSSPVDLMSFFWRQTIAKSPPTAVPSPGYEAGWNAINQWIREDYSWNGREPNVLYARRGDRYVDVSGISGLNLADDSRAFAVTDLNGNGTLDIVLKSRLGPQVRILENNCGLAKTAIAFDLEGVKSNRDSIGARVTIEYASGKRATRQIAAGSGFLSQHTKRLHFGLGDAAKADRVTVKWPSGEQQQFDNVTAGARYWIREGSATLDRTPFKQPATATPAAAALKTDNQPAIGPTWFLEPVPLPLRFAGPGFLLLSNGPAKTPIGVAIQLIDLSKSKPETAAAFAIFRRYLLDWRGPLTVPLLLLIDGQNRVHKIYPDVPSATALQADLRMLTDPKRQRLALPFPGRYVLTEPSRNYYRFGGAFLAAGYPEFGQPYLEEAIRQWPDNAKAHATLGQLHLEADRLADAARHLERASVLNPNAPEVWNSLGGLAMSQGRYNDAENLFSRGIAINASLPYLLANAGQAAARLNKPVPAEEFFRRALAIEPNDADTTDRLGLLLARAGRNAEAKVLFQKALTIDPENASAINNIGVLYLELGQPGDALAAFEYGARKLPSNETVHMNLARIYVQNGQRDRARELLRDFLKRSPESAIARRALAQLDQ